MMPYDDVLELAHVLVRYISLRSEILTAINIKTVDCMDVMIRISKNLLPHPLPWRWTRQATQQKIFNNLPNYAGSHLRGPVLRLHPCFTACPLQSQSHNASKLKDPSTHSAQIPAQTAMWNSRYRVGCPFISVQLVVSDTLYTPSDLCSWLL